MDLFRSGKGLLIIIKKIRESKGYFIDNNKTVIMMVNLDEITRTVITQCKIEGVVFLLSWGACVH